MKQPSIYWVRLPQLEKITLKLWKAHLTGKLSDLEAASAEISKEVRRRKAVLAKTAKDGGRLDRAPGRRAKVEKRKPSKALRPHRQV